MRILAKLIQVSVVLSAIALLYRLMKWEGSSAMLAFAFAAMALLFLVQLLLSLFFLKRSRLLNILSIYISLSLCVAAVGAGLHYLFWHGGLLIGATAFFMLSVSVFLLALRWKKLQLLDDADYQFFRMNLFIPLVYLMLLLTLAIFLPPQTFRQLFHTDQPQMVHDQKLQ